MELQQGRNASDAALQVRGQLCLEVRPGTVPQPLMPHSANVADFVTVGPYLTKSCCSV